MTLYGEPKAQIWKQLMSTSDQPMVAELGQKMVLPKDWPTFFNHSRKEVMKEVLSYFNFFSSHFLCIKLNRVNLLFFNLFLNPKIWS